MADQTSSFSTDEAQQIARDLYGFEADARQLTSYCDQNFLLERPSGSRRILKISNARDDFGVVDLQNQVILQAWRASGHLTVPRVYPTRDDDEIATLKGHTDASRRAPRYHIRMLSYVEGRPWSAASSHSSELRRDLGRSTGELTRALEGFSHPAMHLFREWDLKNFQRVEQVVSAIESSRRRAIISRILDRFGGFVAPRLEGLPASVIHGDINNDNVLLNDGRVVGLIDFGDVGHTATVFEVAIAMAYAMLGAEVPLQAAAEVLSGYQTVRPLELSEHEIVFDLAQARLAASVTFAAHYGRLDPQNAHVSTNAAAAWQVLEALDDRHAEDRKLSAN